MSETKLFIYVSGPYSKGDVDENVRKAVLMGDRLRELGCEVFIPHLCRLWHAIKPHEYEYWMSHDLAWLTKCNAIFRMDGESPGGDREVVEARKLRMPVFYAVSEVEAALEMLRK